MGVSTGTSAMIAPVASCSQICASPIDVGALLGGKTAAGVTDEDHDRVVGFLDRDRVPQAVIVGDACRRHDFIGMGAGAERD